jgi:hypothetical protein
VRDLPTDVRARLPTPRCFRYVNPGAIVGVGDEGDNVTLVLQSAALPAPGGFIEWDWSFERGIGNRPPGALRRRADQLVAGRYEGFPTIAPLGRSRVDEGVAFRYRIPDPTGTVYLHTLASWATTTTS